LAAKFKNVEFLLNNWRSRRIRNIRLRRRLKGEQTKSKTTTATARKIKQNNKTKQQR